jgi:hypothetical protein
MLLFHRQIIIQNESVLNEFALAKAARMPFPTTAVIDDPARTIRHAIRRLRWFKPSFHAQTSAVSAVTGIGYRISDPLLTAAFIGWLDAFDSSAPPR